MPNNGDKFISRTRAIVCIIAAIVIPCVAAAAAFVTVRGTSITNKENIEKLDISVDSNTKQIIQMDTKLNILIVGQDKIQKQLEKK